MRQTRKTVPIELISKPLKTSTFSVPSYYASIVDENNQEYHVKFIFNIQRTDFDFSIKIADDNGSQNTSNGVSKLKIKFYPENYAINENLTNKEFKNKQTKEYDNIEFSKIENDQLLLEYIVDLSSYKPPTYPKARRILSKISSPLKDDTSLDSNIDIKETNLFVIKTFKIDPSTVLKEKLFNKGTKEYKNLANYYLKNALKNLSINYPRYETIIDQNAISTIFMSHIVKIPKKIKGEKIRKFSVVFEPCTQDTYIPTFESVTKNLDLEDLLNNASSLKEPEFTQSINKNYNKLCATLKDNLTNKLFLQKKTIDYNGSTSFYKNINSAALVKDNSIEVSDLQESNKINIYRCISTFDQATSDRSTYKNLVAGQLSFIDSTIMLPSNSGQDKAVKIELLNVPSEVVTYKLEKKVLLQNSDGYDGGMILVSNFRNKDDTIVMDYNVVKNKTYEYFLTYRLKNGNQIASISKLHKYLDPQTVISTDITDVTISENYNGEPKVTFSITAKIEQSHSELLKSALENAGIGEQFAKEIQGEKAFFQNLLFFKVKRINLSASPGVEEEFKDFLDASSFEDDELSRKNSGVSKLDLSQTYQYEIRAFLKNPIELLPKYIKVVEQVTINGTTYKARAYRPYKWFQKSVLESGTTNSENEDGNIINSQFLQDSDIGVVNTVKLDTLKKILGVRNVSANRITVEKITLKWDISNSGDYYDHFVIVKEVNHVRKILTTTHNKNYIDTIDSAKDMGNIRYYITPVYYDYTVGTTVASQVITIDPEEYDQK